MISHVVVITPGRLLDHFEKTKGFSMRHLKHLFLDEPDRLLDLDLGAIFPRDDNGVGYEGLLASIMHSSSAKSIYGSLYSSASGSTSTGSALAIWLKYAFAARFPIASQESSTISVSHPASEIFAGRRSVPSSM